MNPFRENANPRSKMTVIPRCEGCNVIHHIEVPDDWFNDGAVNCSQKIDIYMQETLKWVRRFFAPGINVWFCSRECAYESYRAKEIESYWQ